MHAQFDHQYADWLYLHDKVGSIGLIIPQKLISLEQLKQIIINIRLIPKIFDEVTLQHTLEEVSRYVNRGSTYLADSNKMDSMSYWDGKSSPPANVLNMDIFDENREWCWGLSFTTRHLSSNAFGAVYLACLLVKISLNDHSVTWFYKKD